MGPEVLYPAGTQIDPIASGDFNEDGITDLVVGSGQDPLYPLNVLLGNGTNGVGDGTFGSPTSFDTNSIPTSIATGDFNEDGITDLAMLAGSNGLKVMLGQGTGGKGNGTFGPVTSIIVGLHGTRLLTGDFNEDGITDLLFTQSVSISVMLGQGAAGMGNGTFAAPVSYRAVGATTLLDVGIGDLNGDGIADVAATSASDSVVVMAGGGAAGVGDGTFAFLTRLAGSTQTRSVLIGDFVEDGRPDVAATSVNTARIQVFAGGCPPADVSLAVTAPNGGESWPVGGERTISWTKGTGVVAVNVEITHEGSAWETIAHDVTGTSFTWTVTGPPTCCARLRITDATAPSRQDASDATFAIVPTALGLEPELVNGAFLAPVSPNPFVHGATIRLSVPRAVVGTVDVSSVDGRLMRRLVAGPIAAGSNAWIWDGVDARGRSVPPGIYFVRASWPGFTATRRIVRLE